MPPTQNSTHGMIYLKRRLAKSIPLPCQSQEEYGEEVELEVPQAKTAWSA